MTPRLPCRILVVSGRHWPRALLRAQLRDAGYDTIGAATLSVALSYPPGAPGDVVRLLIVDWTSVQGIEEAGRCCVELMKCLRSSHPEARTILLCQASEVPPPDVWDVVVHAPSTIGQVVAEAQALLNG